MKKNTFLPGGPCHWLPPKILMIMKLIVIILFASLMQVSAASFAQKITLKQKEAPLTSVLQEIRKQTGFDFIYDAKHLAGAPKVNLDVTNTELKDVLTQVFSGQKLDFLIKDKFIVLTPKKKPDLLEEIDASIQTINVRGRILDENGKPLQGVNVKVKSTLTSVVTDSLGRFYIQSIDDKSVLQISFLGYRLVELPAKPVMGDIKLEVMTSELSEITISTGYQKIRREQFVGSFSQLDSASYNRRTGVNIIDRLDGTVTGLLFDKKGGQSDVKAIQIRGISTLNENNTAPLIILDGFVFTGDINTINQNDVANITVLKDAAAAGVWGAKAGNGVIVINTKKGDFNKSLNINATTNLSITDKPDLYYNPKMTSSEFIDIEKFLFEKGFYDNKLNNSDFPFDYPAVTPVVDLLAAARSNPGIQAAVTNAIDKLRAVDIRDDLNQFVYRNAISQQNYLRIGGGSDMLAYSVSAGYNRSLNNIQESKPNHQYTLKSNIMSKPVKNMEVSFGLTYTQNVNNSVDVALPNIVYPYMHLVNEDGVSIPVSNKLRQGYIDTVGNGKLLDWNYRPLDEIRNTDNTQRSRLLLINVSANYRFFDWLNAEIRYQGVNTLGSNRSYYNTRTYYARDLINRYTNLGQTNTDLRNPIPVGGILDVSNTFAGNNQFRAQLNFNRSWAGKHLLNAFIAGETSSSETSSNGNRFYGYDDQYGSSKIAINYNSLFPMIYYPSSTVRIPTGSSAISERNFNRTVSVLSNISYTYNGRYNLYASARRDGTNLFGATTNNKWKPLWSVGASWDISKEDFYKSSWLDYLRVKGTYGYLGNISSANVALATTTNRGADSRTGLIYSIVTTPSNPNLRWEEVSIINGGLEFSIAKNRLSGSLEIFRKTSKDIVSNVPLDPSVGLAFASLNSASLKGKGFELNLQSQNSTGLIKWNTNFGLTYTKTIVTELFSGGYRASDFIAYGLDAAVGMPAYSLAAYRWGGLDPMTGDPLGILNGQVSKNYASIFQDSVQNQIIKGSSIPLYAGFIGNSVSWKNLTLSANITYRLAFYYRKPSINYSAFASTGQAHSDYSFRWQNPGDEIATNVPSLTYPLNSNRDSFYSGSELNVLRGDNIRLQDIRIQYTLGKMGSAMNFIKNLQVFAYVNNLNIILWKKDKSNLDPDYSGGNLPSSFPASRSYSFGVNLNL